MYTQASTTTYTAFTASTNSLVIKLGEWQGNYMRYLKIRERSDPHLERVEISLGHFRSWLAASGHLGLNIDVLEEFAYWLMTEARPFAGTARQGKPGTLSVASRRAYLIDLRSFLKWCGVREYLADKVHTWVAIPARPKKKPKRAYNDDIQRILKVAAENLRDYTLCCLLIDVGPRAGELATLLIEKCDLDRRVLEVTGKTGERSMMISSFAEKPLREWLKIRDTHAGYVFPGGCDGHITPSGISQLMGRLKERAGVKGRVNPHAWRHAYITSTLLNGGNLGMTRIQAGHANISTTQMYLEDFIGDELRDYQERITPLPALEPYNKPTAADHPRPIRSELEAAIWEQPNWEALGRRFGVSGVSVKKWAKKWDLVAVYDEAKEMID